MKVIGERINEDGFVYLVEMDREEYLEFYRLVEYCRESLSGLRARMFEGMGHIPYIDEDLTDTFGVIRAFAEANLYVNELKDLAGRFEYLLELEGRGEDG